VEPTQTPEEGTVPIATQVLLRKKVFAAHFKQSVAAGPLQVAQAELQTLHALPVEN
jgi:hypothetical protein